MVFASGRLRWLGAAGLMFLWLGVPLAAGAFGTATPRSGVGVDRALSAQEAADLAEAGVGDDAALAELRAVTSIDGQPANLVAATQDLGEGPARAARLRALSSSLESGTGASTSGPPRAGPAEARRQALDVLARDRYQEREVPRPFRGALQWLADRFRPVVEGLSDLVRPILDLPGGRYLLLALLIGSGAALVAWIVRRRSRADVVIDRGRALGLDPGDDPLELDRRAAAAEAAGDNVEALRLRHLAGLIRLTVGGRLHLEPATTVSDAARQVGDPRLDGLTAEFEEAVYGGRVPSRADLDRARVAWAELAGVAAGVGRRG